ncbi:MAG: diaminopimelate epimerase [Thermoanaerobaculia bacterium]|nr:diaminopimelate epimerase [Thermoanaerobaculia bacterium]
MKLHKLSGAGNDFLAWAEGADAGPADPSSEPTVEQMVAWCRRGVSIGADGFLVLRRGDRPGDVRVIHRDADGSRPELCLNGSRCAVELSTHLGWADDDAVRLRTDLGPIDTVRVRPGRTQVTVPEEMLGSPDEYVLDVAGSEHRGQLVRVGGPHFVLEWPDDLETAPVLGLGSALRRHPGLGPAGANVHFVHWHGTTVHLRSFERGVEGETLACGTGSLAASLVGEAERRLPGLRRPVDVITRGGFRLGVGRDDTGRLTLEGDARRVAVVEVLEGAGA